jgi:hypothetical protein
LGIRYFFEPSETISKLIEKVKTVKKNLGNDETAKIGISCLNMFVLNVIEKPIEIEL